MDLPSTSSHVSQPTSALKSAEWIPKVIDFKNHAVGNEPKKLSYKVEWEHATNGKKITWISQDTASRTVPTQAMAAFYRSRYSPTSKKTKASVVPKAMWRYIHMSPVEFNETFQKNQPTAKAEDEGCLEEPVDLSTFVIIDSDDDL